jgi:soluble lytic murein transglycosylase-like protein
MKYFLLEFMGYDGTKIQKRRISEMINWKFGAGLERLAFIFIAFASMGLVVFGIVAESRHWKARQSFAADQPALTTAVERLGAAKARRAVLDKYADEYLLLPAEWEAVRQTVIENTDAAITEVHVARIIFKESRGNPLAVGAQGEVGLMQIKPHIAAPHLKAIGQKNLFDPATNVRVGIMELRRLLVLMKGDLGLAIACYAGGPNDAIYYARGIL